MMTVLLFMSYADEDKDIAQEIAERLSQRHVKVYPTQRGHVKDSLVTGDPESEISRADAFLALLSPSFLASSSCRRERELALHRERRGCVPGAKPDFVQVLQVRATPYHEAGPLRGRPWFDMTTARGRENALNDLISKFEPPDKHADESEDEPEDEPAGNAGAAGAHRGLPGFRNREEELNRVLDGLTKEDGQHFWLVIAPPQLGKSWFLDRISNNIQAAEPDRWVVKLVDVREQPPEVQANAEALLGLMFGSAHPLATDADTLRGLAIDVIKGGRFHLCLLDSAELLDKKTARMLRSFLSQVNRHVEDARLKNVRLALIVASRREEWLGVTPKPRLQLLPLTKFKVEVMSEALQEMSDRMERNFSSVELQRHAELVYRLSEGLPALLYKYLNWIHEQQWTDLGRLRQKQQFDRLTKPYIDQQLVSAGSLFGYGAAPTSAELFGLEQALRVLVPYRLFTQAHLRHHAEPDGTLDFVLRTLGWSVEELWDAVSSTDLLYRPLREPWQAIYAPIRRLLCRYWYSSQEHLAQAHLEAGRFVRSWANGEMGSDQSVVLVECLWHESQVLRLSRAANAEEKLTGLAAELSRGLVSSPAYTKDNLRQYAVNRMQDDDELVEAVDQIGISFDSLIDGVLRLT